MEAKFNFKSQVCTSIEQSRRLLELGLKKETADMAYLWYGRAEDDTPLLMDKPSIVYQGIMTAHDLPAWSLGRLIEMVSKTQYPYYVISKTLPIYDALCERIEWLIKEGYFPKEYLV